MGRFCKDTHKPALPSRTSGCLAGCIPKTFCKKRKNEISPKGAQHSGTTDKAFAKRAGGQKYYRRGLPKLCQVTGFLRQSQVFALTFFGAGQVRWSAVAGKNRRGRWWPGGQRPVIIFSRSFLVRFFHRLGKNEHPPPKATRRRYKKGAQVNARQKLVKCFPVMQRFHNTVS